MSTARTCSLEEAAQLVGFRFRGPPGRCASFAVASAPSKRVKNPVKNRRKRRVKKTGDAPSSASAAASASPSSGSAVPRALHALDDADELIKPFAFPVHLCATGVCEFLLFAGKGEADEVAGFGADVGRAEVRESAGRQGAGGGCCWFSRGWRGVGRCFFCVRMEE